MPVSRGRFLRLTSSGAVAAAGAAAATEAAVLSAPDARVIVGKATGFQVGKQVSFTYPDSQSPAVAVRVSHPVEGGVGPGRDIVAYSRICVHKGCPVNYDASREIFVCPCHYSVYDAGKEGEVVVGHATTNLPRILLHYDAATGDVVATGVDGLLYGRFNDAKLS
jgi:arsenite oxidase small subunit